jgi:hypothetical protein
MKGGNRITVPLFEDTKAIIEATPITGADTYLVTSFGKTFTLTGSQQDAGMVRRGRLAGMHQPRPAQIVPGAAGRGRLTLSGLR